MAEQSSIFTNIKSVIRNSSQDRLKYYSKRDDIEIQDFNTDKIVLGHWMMLILVAGQDIRVTFKIHYTTTNAKYFAKAIYDKEDSEITSAQVDDYLKEVCNLTAGNIKRVLELNNAKTSISLPVKTLGFDDIFFPLISGATAFNDSWQLTTSECYLNCSSMIEIYNPNLKIDASLCADMAEEDEIEFF